MVVMENADDAANLLTRLGAEAVPYRSFDATPMPGEGGKGWKLLAAMSAPPAATPPDPGEAAGPAEPVMTVTEDLPIACTEAAVLALEDEPPRPARRPARAKPAATQGPADEPAPRRKQFGAMFKRSVPDAAPENTGTDLAALFARLA